METFFVVVAILAATAVAIFWLRHGKCVDDEPDEFEGEDYELLRHDEVYYVDEVIPCARDCGRPDCPGPTHCGMVLIADCQFATLEIELGGPVAAEFDLTKPPGMVRVKVRSDPRSGTQYRLYPHSFATSRSS